jgi:hypothetical protein
VGYNKEASSDFIVYVAKFRGKVMYIGEGKPYRYLHLTSGTSHCYLANKHHFEGNPLSIEVVADFLTKEDARKREAELILELQPEWNKSGLVDKLKVFDRMEIMRVNQLLIEEFKTIRKPNCKGLTLLRLLTPLVNREGYVEMTGKKLKELSRGELTSKFVAKMIKGVEWTQYVHMDEYLVVTKPQGVYGHTTGYQLTQKVLDTVPDKEVK